MKRKVFNRRAFIKAAGSLTVGNVASSLVPCLSSAQQTQASLDSPKSIHQVSSSIAVVRVICFTMIFSAFSFRARAEDFTDAVHAYLQHSVNLGTTNSGIVVGLVDEHESRVVSYGKLDNGTDAEVNGDTLFEIGSVTKTFTGLLLQDMIARREMHLDDPEAKHLPTSVKPPAFDGKEITLLQLATHTSGLPRDPDNLDPIRAENLYGDYTAEKLYAFLSHYKLTRDPGAQYEYSNLGVGLLGHAIALKAGVDYESLVVDRICRPLKMESTRITLTPELKKRFATGHNRLGYAVSAWDVPVLSGAGALRSTANDLLKYVSANLGLTPSGLTPLMEETQGFRFHQSTHTDVGLIWKITNDPGKSQIIWHGGTTAGFNAFIGFNNATRRGAVILSNSDDFSFVYNLGVFLLVCEWQAHQQPTDTKTDSDVYSSYVGQYQPSPDFAMRMRLMRQYLVDSPKAPLYIPAGLYTTVLFVVLWRTNSFRKRWTIRGYAVLISGLLVALVALALSHVAGERFAYSQPGIAIRHEGNRLFAQPTGSRSWPFDAVLPLGCGELLRESQSHFVERLNGTLVAFSRDARGNVTGLTMDYRGKALSYGKISNQPLNVPEPPKQRVAVELDTKLLDACVGQYEFVSAEALPAGGRLKVWREGDQLIGQVRGDNVGPGAFNIYPDSETTFFLKIDGAQLTFVKNVQGEVTNVVRHKEGQVDIEGKKVGNE